MNNNSYELHTYEDPSFPFIFHHTTLSPYYSDFLSHWHENVELLFVIEGEITVMSDANIVTAHKDDIVFINSNNVHHIHTDELEAKYYCLIIGGEFSMEHGLDTEEVIFQRLISDNYVKDKYLAIKEEFRAKKVLYKSAIKSLVMEMLIYLYREYAVSETTLSNKRKTEKIVIIKKAIRYIQDNYQKNITVLDTAEYVGLSKYYFCHIFKEFTGITTVRYINILRCENAKKMLQNGDYRVEEVAYLCGFDNLSYFTKTYKRYMGCLPSFSKKEGASTQFPSSIPNS